MSDTTVRMREIQEALDAAKVRADMIAIEQRTAQWVAEQQAMVNGQRAKFRPFEKPPPEEELPSAGELEACIRQAPERWQGVVMASITLQGRSIEAAVAAVNNPIRKDEDKVKLTLMTATELLETERARREQLVSDAGHIKDARQQTAAFQQQYGGNNQTVQQWQEEASRAMAANIDAEMMKAYTNVVINPSMIINPKDTTS